MLRDREKKQARNSYVRFWFCKETHTYYEGKFQYQNKYFSNLSFFFQNFPYIIIKGNTYYLLGKII